jgi:hypothetical protein
MPTDAESPPDEAPAAKTGPAPPSAADVFAGEEAQSELRGFIAERAYFEDITGTPKAKKEQEALPADLIDWLDAEEFRHIGTFQESTAGFPAPRLTTVSFVDPGGAIRVSTSYNKSMGFEPQGVLFTFYSYFEDGSAVVSWCVEDPRTKSTVRLKSLGTTGSIADDYERQRLQVAGRVELGAMPVSVESREDIRATYFHYYRQLIPDESVWMVIGMWLTHRALPAVFIGAMIVVIFQSMV